MGDVRYDIDRDGIAELVLDRPPVNALSLSLLSDLSATLREIEGHPDVRGVLVRGEGRCFSAGLDLREVLTLDERAAVPFLSRFDEVYGTLYRLTKPVAVAVSAHAIAGGLVLALTADFLALPTSPDVRLGLTELAVGVPFPRVAFEIVHHALSPRAFRALVYGAGTVNPRVAYDMGVGDVLSADPLGDARQWLQTVVSRPLRTFALAKTSLRAESWARIDRLAEAEYGDFVDAITSPQAQQALANALRR